MASVVTWFRRRGLDSVGDDTKGDLIRRDLERVACGGEIGDDSDGGGDASDATPIATAAISPGAGFMDGGGGGGSGGDPGAETLSVSPSSGDDGSIEDVTSTSCEAAAQRPHIRPGRGTITKLDPHQWTDWDFVPVFPLLPRAAKISLPT